MAVKLPQIPAIAGSDTTAVLQALKEIVDVRNGQRPGASGDRFTTADEANAFLTPAYLCVVDEKAANTAAGGFTNAAWRQRVLNTIRSQVGINASLASNQILLEAGIYLCRITCPANNVGRHKARLRNMTDGVDLLIGTSAMAGAAAQTASIISGRIDLTAAKVLEVQHQCQTTVATNGLGLESNFAVAEVYTVAEFWKQRSV